MNIDSINLTTQSIDRSVKSPAELKQKQLKQASVDFESMLLQQMFQSMQKTLDSGGIVGQGLSGSVYSGFLTEAISKEMASHQSLGLGEQLYKQILRREPEIQKLEKEQAAAKQPPTTNGLTIGHNLPLENVRRGLGAIQMLPAEPLLKMGTESAENADIDRKAKGGL